jgi:hypothetical protein
VAAEQQSPEIEPEAATAPQSGGDTAVVGETAGTIERASGQSPAAAQAAATLEGFDERPELYIAGAFVGGLALALILKRVTGG